MKVGASDQFLRIHKCGFACQCGECDDSASALFHWCPPASDSLRRGVGVVIWACFWCYVSLSVCVCLPVSVCALRLGSKN